MRNKTYPPKATFESAWALIQENAQNAKKYDQYIEEMRQDREAMRQTREKNEKEREEAKREREKEWKEFRESMKAMQREMGGMGQSNGEIAESYFFNSFDKSMEFAGQKYDSILRNHKQKNKRLNLQGEYDMVLFNCISVVIIETKYKARKDHVEDILKKPPVFKQLFSQYADYDLYLGLAAFHFEDGVEEEAKKQGVAVIKQVGDNTVIYDEHLKLF